MKAIKTLTLIATLSAATVSAQAIDPWLADRLNNQINQNSSTSQAEANRRAQQEWQAREDAIQAKIAKWRATPYYGSLGVDLNSNKIGWGGGGYISKNVAEKKVLNICGSGNCKVLITISNTCAGAARPEWAKDSSHWIVMTDRDPKRAVEKAYYACEKKYGAGKCIYAKNSNTAKYFDTYCSGYDYESYNQQ